MAFLSSSPLPDEDPSAPPLEPALAQDMARMFKLLGVQVLRASVVDTRSMAFQDAWALTADGGVSEGPAERGLDSVLPGASSVLSQLAGMEQAATHAQKLSPRRWVFAWLIGEGTAILAEAHFRDRRDGVSPVDTALLRLVCGAGIRGGLHPPSLLGASPTPPPLHALVWPQIERRARPASNELQSRLGLGLTLGLAACSVAVALLGWQADRDAKAARAESLALHQMADATLVHAMSVAMATGDYGEAQTALNGFAALGYFESAVVVNPKGRIVALAGARTALRIGDAVSPETLASLRSLALKLGSEANGRLLLGDAKADASFAAGGLILRAAAALTALLALGLVALQVRRWRRD